MAAVLEPSPPSPRPAPGPARLRRHRGTLLVVLPLALLLLFAIHIPLPADWLDKPAAGLIVQDPLQPADAIIVLEGDEISRDRVTAAANLYLAGWAPRIVLVGDSIRDAQAAGENVGRFQPRDVILEHDGVPASAIVEQPHTAVDTYDELRRAIGLLPPGTHHVIIVTSWYHTRRAQTLWHIVAPPDVTASLEPSYAPTTVWLILHELAGFVDIALGFPSHAIKGIH